MQAPSSSIAGLATEYAMPALAGVNTGAPPFNSHIARSVEELDDLSHEWSQLTAESKGTPFQSFSWNRAWYRHFSDHYDEMLVFSFTAGLKTVAIIPLYRKGRSLRLAADHVCDQQDAIAGDTEAVCAGLREVLRWAWRNGCHLKLRQIPEHGWLHQAALSLGAIRGRIFKFHHCYAPCPRVDLPESGDAFVQQLPRKIRGDMRRHLNKLDREHPGAELEIHRAGQLPDGLIDQVADFHASHFRKDGVSLLADPRFRKLVADAARAADSGIRVSTLRDGDDLMAMDIGFTFKRAYHGFLTTFDLKHRKVSPGSCLLIKRLDWFIQRDGVESLDFLLGGEQYKYQFAKSEYNVCAFYLYPWSISNAVRWIAEMTRHAAKRSAKRALKKAGLYKVKA